jgi:hypothetical protein
MQKSSSLEWYTAIIASALLILRAGLRLVSGPPQLGQGPTTERMNTVFLVILIAVLAYSLINLTRITRGREGMRIFTAILLGLGLLSGITVFFIGD